MPMQPTIILCVAPVLSVLRPALGPSVLKATLADQPVDTQVRYLNIAFAERIGIDLNEWLAEDVPTHLLVGDWLFAHLVATPDSSSVARHTDELRRYVDTARWRELQRIRSEAVHFVDACAIEILDTAPMLVGFSTVFQQTGASLAIAAAIKRRSPDTLICFGGANCHGTMGTALLSAFGQIDSVFTGYADEAFPAYVQALRSGDGAPLHGVVSRTHSAPATPAPQPRMDALPTPDHSDYFARLAASTFHAQVHPAIPFESSRGCWWGQKHHCTFCGLNSDSMAFNAKSAARVLEETRALAQRHGIERFCAADNIMALDHIDGVFGALAADPTGWKFFYEIKANLSEPQLRKLALGGVTWVQPGIESLDDSVLRIMRKGVTALANVRLLRNCAEIGVGAVWNILYGFPDEAPEAYARMTAVLPLLEHLRPPTSCSRIRIDRFSPNFEQSAAMGFTDVQPVVAYAALYGLDAPLRHQLAYFFDGNPKQGDDFRYVDALRAAVQRWRAHWYAESGTPELRIERLGEVGLLIDTRSCAQQPVQLLDECQLALLDGLRNPSPVRTVLQSVAAKFHGADVVALFAQLVDDGLVLVDGNAALALPTESAGEIVAPEASEDYPWGYRRAPADALQPGQAVPTASESRIGETST
jgi:ribosomal peptide maturation radical SAM protein 1